MIRDRLERIKERAYALWERAGGSHGEDEHHWHQASTEIDAEDKAPRRGRKPGSGAAKAGGASAKKPATKQASSNPASEPKVTSKATRGAHKVAEAPVVKSSGTQSVKPRATKAGGAGAAPAATTPTSAKPAPAASNSDVGRKAKPGRKSAPKG